MILRVFRNIFCYGVVMITYSKTVSTFSLQWQGVIVGTALLVSKAEYTVVFAVAMAATM